MPKKPKRPCDTNQLAHLITADAGTLVPIPKTAPPAPDYAAERPD